MACDWRCVNCQQQRKACPGQQFMAQAQLKAWGANENAANIGSNKGSDQHKNNK